MGRKWPTVVLVFAVGVAIALFIAQDPATLHVRTARFVGDPAFPDYVVELVNAPVSKGDTYVVLQNGDEIFAAMLRAIEQAHGHRHDLTFDLALAIVAPSSERSRTRRRAWGPRPSTLLGAP